MTIFGNLNNAVDDVIEAYCRNCAVEMSWVDLARAVAFLANRGVSSWSNEKILDPSFVKRISTLMLTCGTNDAAGDFAFRIGLPAKGGTGGGIVPLIPGECGICEWNSALEDSGDRWIAGAGNALCNQQAPGFLNNWRTL